MFLPRIEWKKQNEHNVCFTSNCVAFNWQCYLALSFCWGVLKGSFRFERPFVNPPQDEGVGKPVKVCLLLGGHFFDLKTFDEHRDRTLCCVCILPSQNTTLDKVKGIQSFFCVWKIKDVVAAHKVKKCFRNVWRPYETLIICNYVERIFNMKNEWLPPTSFFQYRSKISRVLPRK